MNEFNEDIYLYEITLYYVEDDTEELRYVASECLNDAVKLAEAYWGDVYTVIGAVRKASLVAWSKDIE